MAALQLLQSFQSSIQVVSKNPNVPLVGEADLVTHIVPEDHESVVDQCLVLQLLCDDEPNASTHETKSVAVAYFWWMQLQRVLDVLLFTRKLPLIPRTPSTPDLDQSSSEWH